MKHIITCLVLITLVASKKTICPGGKFTCPEDFTCCELKDGSYGCCVVKDGVCCEDRIHCCPQNTKCSNGECIQNYQVQFKTAFNSTISNHITCQGGQSTCPDDTTCCYNSESGSYSCCPFSNAVCCNDGEHCCPSNTVCDLSHQECKGDIYASHFYSTIEKKQFPLSEISFIQLQIKNVMCPDSEYQCPDGYTCCKLPSGDWGCCPFTNATCCKNGLRCCPENMHCDETSQYCTQVSSTTYKIAVPSKPAKRIGKTCPDKSQCENTDTCCPLSAAKFGCCHYANATCCSDNKHCCPFGFRCMLSHQICVPDYSWQLDNEI